MKTNARLITSWRCDKACQGCCNTYSQIMNNAVHIHSLDELASYNNIAITGGEPMLNHVQLAHDIADLRRINPTAKIYLYSALYTLATDMIARLVDGIHFTIHEGATPHDVGRFQQAQWVFRTVKTQHPNKSFRLYVDPRVDQMVAIFPNVWTRLEVKPWMTEEELFEVCPSGLPRKEDLLILDRPATSFKEFQKHTVKLEKRGKF